ncbi:recombinase family protein [Fervidobacterium thailandense]|uniref:recombinase family protein n=1 Tax=Fervidobacterium thailandense TaxID=1008305 RepID=UPI0008FC2A04|nr:recombinase family protein [Fervidobacterium thailandense]
MKRAVAYAKFSTANQQDTSVEKQLEDIREYCRRKGYTIVSLILTTWDVEVSIRSSIAVKVCGSY